MNLLCIIGLHNWNGCLCLRCRKVKKEGHNWDDCICSICGRTRDEGHIWNGCKCTKCQKVRDEGHIWNGCKCTKCQKVRDEGHDWNGCICKICKQTRNEEHLINHLSCAICDRCNHFNYNNHLWDKDVCSKCGTIKLSDEERYNLVMRDSTTKFYLFAPDYNALPVESRYKDFQIFYNKNSSKLIDAIFIEYSILSYDQPVILLCINEKDAQELPIPSYLLSGYDIFFDGIESVVRRREYLSRLEKNVHTSIINNTSSFSNEDNRE